MWSERELEPRRAPEPLARAPELAELAPEVGREQVARPAVALLQAAERRALVLGRAVQARREQERAAVEPQRVARALGLVPVRLAQVAQPAVQQVRAPVGLAPEPVASELEQVLAQEQAELAPEERQAREPRARGVEAEAQDQPERAPAAPRARLELA